MPGFASPTALIIPWAKLRDTRRRVTGARLRRNGLRDDATERGEVDDVVEFTPIGRSARPRGRADSGMPRRPPRRRVLARSLAARVREGGQAVRGLARLERIAPLLHHQLPGLVKGTCPRFATWTPRDLRRPALRRPSSAGHFWPNAGVVHGRGFGIHHCGPRAGRPAHEPRIGNIPLYRAKHGMRERKGGERIAHDFGRQEHARAVAGWVPGCRSRTSVRLSVMCFRSKGAARLAPNRAPRRLRRRSSASNSRMRNASNRARASASIVARQRPGAAPRSPGASRARCRRHRRRGHWRGIADPRGPELGRESCRTGPDHVHRGRAPPGAPQRPDVLPYLGPPVTHPARATSRLSALA